ncbi:orotidine-5'-phosphate decarboxylase [bacterium]|nr:orotidine-5'-phosphate decarboxylase [bacterium]
MKDRVILALDYPDADSALAMAEKIHGHVGGVKGGFELFVSAGPDLVRELVKMKHNVFLDLKMLDIPNTVAMAARAAVRLGVSMLNVHAMGGAPMLRDAAEAVRDEAQKLGMRRKPFLIAVTILTSMDTMALESVGLTDTPHDAALNLARLSQVNGLDGVVCSAREAGAIKEMCGPRFIRVTPGIRPSWASNNDQKRVMTPAEAIEAGSSYIVVGRPITEAPDPVAAAQTLFD